MTKLRGHGHKTLSDWAGQMLIQVRGWLPQRAIILVADSSFAVLELLEALRQLPQAVHVVRRLRLDAALYEPAPLCQQKQMGRPRKRKVGKRLPTLKSVLKHPQINWQSLTLQGWYGGRSTPVQVRLSNSRVLSHWTAWGADTLGTGHRPHQQS